MKQHDVNETPQLFRQLRFGDPCRLKDMVDGHVIYGRYFGYGRGLAKMGRNEYRTDEAIMVLNRFRLDRSKMPTHEELEWQRRSWERSIKANKLVKTKVSNENYGKSVSLRWEDKKWIKDYEHVNNDLAWILFRGWEKDLAWRFRNWWVVQNPNHPDLSVLESLSVFLSIVSIRKQPLVLNDIRFTNR